MNAVPNALSSDRESLPNALRTTNFSSVTGEAQTGAPCFPIKLFEPDSRSSLLISAKADGHHTPVPILFGECKNAAGMLDAKLADGIENPSSLNARKSRRFGMNRFKNLCNALLLPQDHTSGERDFCIADILRDKTF